MYDIYQIKLNDTIESLANRYGTTIEELRRLNPNSSFGVGSNIIVPTTKEYFEVYTIEKGDNLYNIARKYNTSVDNLKSINNITTDSLAIGQIIKLPSTSSTASDTYIVKKGDSLYSIARTYNTSVDKLKEINNLTSNALAIGQVLKLPSSNASENVVYTVKKGDSLYSIAREYGTTVDAIKKLNNITSNTLSIGQKLLLP